MSSRASGADELIVIRGKPQLRSFEAYLVAERELPVIGVSSAQEQQEPVLSLEAIRAVTGPGVRVYFVPGEYLLRRLSQALGASLALSEGCVRVWWPGFSSRSEPDDHPLVVGLVGLPAGDTLIEFERAYELSRPVVRREVKLIEDARAVLHDQLTSARGQIRELEEHLRDTRGPQRRVGASVSSGRTAPPAGQAVDSLTPREREVLGFLTLGYTHAQVASALYIGVETVRTHVASIRRKLGVKSKRDLIGVSVRTGA